MALDIHYLKAFYHLCLTKSFTEAAKRLHVTQSAVSHSIKKLEQTAEVELIDKSGSKFKLTDNGKIIFKTCEEIFSKIEDAEETIKQESLNNIVNITIGSTVEFGTTILINSFKDFFINHENFYVDFKFHHELFERLLKNEVDLIVDCTSHYHESIDDIILCNEPYSVISTPLYAKEHNLHTLDNLNNATVLSLDSDGVWWERFVSAIPPDMNFYIKRFMEINHIRGLINGTLAGLGISLVPRYTVTNELRNGILIELFKDIKPKEDKFKIYLKKDKINRRKFKLIIEYLQSKLSAGLE
ncbi:MAG: LysR family transcriptional regulator [Candidatus Delongbacteria bacterium]|nr:LysR family transcriptional regulator [Candidatus Delongbacteria bacterium]MBN2837010.1 LysR family transcriptional regulator [Candidatus Delongbacteria bacterium]